MTALIPMPTIESSAGREQRIDEAELAAAAFLARYQGSDAARHAGPRTNTDYDHRRQSFDRHAAYVVVAFLCSAGGASSLDGVINLRHRRRSSMGVWPAA